MSTRSQLLALNDELRRLKAGGQRTVAVTDAGLAELRAAVQTCRDDLQSARAVPESSPPMATRADSAQPPARPEPPAVRTGPEPARLAPPAASLPPPPVVALPDGDKAARWTGLRESVLTHPVCLAHVRPGKKIVFGAGNLDAPVFFCGEAPGADEEVEGEPFVGAAGQLLTKMINGMGLQREQVYIGNIMNWRPEIPIGPGGVQVGNRPPTDEEMNFCLPFLKAQLAIVQPKVIVALGKTAAAGLLGAGTFKAVGEVRGRWHSFAGVPMMVTFHPSYILRNQSNLSKRQIWEDLLMVMERLALPISAKQRGFFL